MVWNFRSLDIEASACVLSSRYAMLCYAMLELSFPGTFAPGSESSWNFRSHDIRSWICTHTRLRPSPSCNVCFTNAL